VNSLLLYSTSHVLVKDFAQVMQSLAIVEALSDHTMKQFLAVIKAILPPDHNLTDQRALEKMVLSSIPSVERIHACANHCVLFTAEFHSLDLCPHCQCPRFYTTEDRTSQPVNVFRYVPLERQLQVLFLNPISAESMRLDPSRCIGAAADNVYISDITESVGFKEKVVDSKFLTDVRNPVFMVATDGVNLNGRKSRAAPASVWPYLLTFANIPRAVRHRRGNVILAGLVATHVIVDGKKKYGSPTSLNAYTEFIVCALSKLNGVTVRDSSYPLHDPKSTFTLSVMLLGTISDLDGLYKLLNMVGAGGKRCCPKCTISGKFCRSVKTRVFGQARRFLDPQDPARTDAKYGAREMRSPPALRTHAHMKYWGKRSAKLRYKKPVARYTEHVTHTGLTDLSPLVDTSPFLQSTGFDPQDQCWLDLMHLIQNIVNLKMMSRIGGRISAPTMPINKGISKSSDELAKMSASVRGNWERKWSARNEEVKRLKAVREEIIAKDGIWEISSQSKLESDQRFRELVCPTSFFNKNKPIWVFTGSWKTNDWQHFMERHAALALYGFLDDERFILLIELFDILSWLAKYSHTRNELKTLRVRTVRALAKFKLIGALQESTIVFHLLIHLIDQAMRWGPPASVWMYPYERYLGFLCRQLKSKRYPEANILRRYCKSRASCAGFSSVSLDRCNRDLINSARINLPPDNFSRRPRGPLYIFSDVDIEQMHALRSLSCELYGRVSTEWSRAHKDADCKMGIGVAIQRWDLWKERHTVSKFYRRNNPVSLQAAIEIFRLRSCRAIKGGVWHSGERRSGAVNSAAPHNLAQSVFEFVSGDEFMFGRILFLFEIEFPVPQNPKGKRKLAKVQILDYVAPDDLTRLPIVVMSSANREAIVELTRIGRVIVCARHPNPNEGADRFLVLPWPRQMEGTNEFDDGD